MHCNMRRKSLLRHRHPLALWFPLNSGKIKNKIKEGSHFRTITCLRDSAFIMDFSESKMSQIYLNMGLWPALNNIGLTKGKFVSWEWCK